MKKTITNENERVLQKWMDKQDVLQKMSISEGTLKNWRKKKLLPYARIGKKIYYREHDIQAMLERHMRDQRWNGRER